MNGTYFLHPSWPLFFEDNHLLVLYKPAGLLVQGDQTGDESLLELAKGWLKRRHDKPGRVFLSLVHRLDRPVAGVMVFCRTSKAAARLSEQFRSGTVRKTYLAVTEGRIEQSEGRLINLLERRNDRSSRIVLEPGQNTREARLSYRVLDRAVSRSLVEIELETGRRHQIRLQLSHIGFPIVGDVRYGASSPMPRGQIALLARKLSFEHPTRKEMLEFMCPLPHGWPWPMPRAGGIQAPPWNWAELATGGHKTENSGCKREDSRHESGAA
jgi:23S rRNA pseudouridine1911/1915/1917 synthase